MQLSAICKYLQHLIKYNHLFRLQVNFVYLNVMEHHLIHITMNRIFIITALIFLTALPVYSQNSEKELDQIRDWFKEANSNISQYRKVEYPDIKVIKDINPEQYSMEGEEIYRLEKVHMTKFFEDEQLVKVALEFYGDREDLISEYYFKNGNLFFVDKIKTIYHRPKRDDAFKESERSIAKNRFYIKDNQLIRWINPDINSVGKIDPSYHDHEVMILNDHKLYTSID